MIKSSSVNVVFALTLTMLFYCLDYYFRISPSLIIPQLMNQYGIGAMGIGSFASSFYLGYLIFQIPIGYIIDCYPIRRILFLCILTCIVSFLAFLLCHKFWLGCLLRFVIGATSAFSFVTVLYIAQNYCAANLFNFITGLTISVGTVTAALADVASSLLQEKFNWQSIMSSIAILGLIIAFACLLPMSRLKATHHHNKNIIDQFRKVQLKSFFKEKLFLINALVGGLIYAPTSIIAAVWGVFFMKNHYHLDQVSASHGILYLFIGWAIGSPIVGYLGDNLKCSIRLLIIGSSVSIFLSTCYLYLPAANQLQIYLLLFFLGLASSSQVIIWKFFSFLCPPDRSGTGIALTNMIITLVCAVIHFLVGWLLTNTDYHSSTQLYMFEKAWWLIPTCFVLSTFLSTLLLFHISKANQQCGAE